MSKHYTQIMRNLHSAEERFFEREALPFVRFLWPGAYIPIPRQSTLDRAGVDIVAHNETGKLEIEVAVQCKGFLVTESEVGKSQITQCLESIEKFKSSGIKVKRYILLHNRIPNNVQFRNELDAATSELVKLGLASQAHVWNYQKLVQETKTSISSRLESLLSMTDSMAEELRGDYLEIEPIESVPLTISRLSFSANAVTDEEFVRSTVANPAKEIAKSDISNLSLILAPAGYGKTVTALRIHRETERRVFYASAASIPAKFNSQSQLIRHLIDFEDLWDQIPDEDIPLLDGLVMPQLKKLLMSDRTAVTLVLDALDESVYFSRTGGIQQLLNQIREFNVPIVLLAREEYWESKRTDFAAIFGASTKRKERNHKFSLNVLRLRDWTTSEIEVFCQRFIEKVDPTNRRRIEHLSEIVRSGAYEEYYGDIPKRPLFLRYIVESVAEHGVQRTERATLFLNWVILKIQRDILNPLKAGGMGRLQPNPTTEDLSSLTSLLLEAMKFIAKEMTAVESGRLELLQEYELDLLLETKPKFSGVLSPLGIFLCSLVVPVQSRSRKRMVRFGHRTYQEFFLAWYIIENPQIFSNCVLPDQIRSHMDDINNAEEFF